MQVQLEFTLSIGALSEEVSVEVSAPLLQVTSAEISDIIETREVEQIPLNGRQFLQLAQLSDAVVLPPGGTRGGALQQAGPLPNVGGQRAGSGSRSAWESSTCWKNARRGARHCRVVRPSAWCWPRRSCTGPRS